MDPMSAGFLGFMLLGALWVVWRIGKYVRFHQGRTHAWSQFDSKEEFQQFLDNLKDAKRIDKPVSSRSGPQDSASRPAEEPAASRPDKPRE